MQNELKLNAGGSAFQEEGRWEVFQGEFGKPSLSVTSFGKRGGMRALLRASKTLSGVLSCQTANPESFTVSGIANLNNPLRQVGGAKRI